MLESEVERHLIKVVEASGKLCVKWVPSGKRGWPDRILLFPDKPAIFVELKAPGEKPRGQQLLRHEELRRLGFEVWTCDSKLSVEKLIEVLVPF